MKVTDWRRKLAASLVAGGLMAPCALYGANLNTNLVPDPSFENVSGITCCFTATELNSWQDGTQHGFAYTYGQGYDNRGPLLGGNPPPSSGTYYFSPNADNSIADVTTPGQVSQNLDVSAGATATQIASGEAAVAFQCLLQQLCRRRRLWPLARAVSERRRHVSRHGGYRRPRRHHAMEAAPRRRLCSRRHDKNTGFCLRHAEIRRTRRLH